MARDGYYMSYAIGADLTAWGNAWVALIVAETNALDWFISANITHTKPKTININPMTAGHYPKRLDTGRIRGKLATTHYLQTGILTYAVMGKCSTSTANGDPYTKAITKATTETPVSIAFHYEKEGTTASRRKDMMGVVPRSLDISVSEINPIARQIYTCDFAYTGPGSDLAQPTAFTQTNLPLYNWYDYKSASGASEFLYHGGAINVDIVSVDMHIAWGEPLFGTYDLNAYPTNGLMKPPFLSSVDLGVRITDAAGTDINTIADTAHGSYAGDLDFIADFYKSADDYLKYTWDKMYIDPESYEEVFQAEGDWFDGAKFTLKFLNENSSLAVEEKSLLDKTYYEND